MIVEVYGSPSCRLMLLGGRLSSFVSLGRWPYLGSGISMGCVSGCVVIGCVSCVGGVCVLSCIPMLCWMYVVCAAGFNLFRFEE